MKTILGKYFKLWLYANIVISLGIPLFLIVDNNGNHVLSLIAFIVSPFIFIIITLVTLFVMLFITMLNS